VSRSGPPGIPSQWAQAFPRAIGLEPDGFLVPAATLRHLLARGNPPNLIFTGNCFAPCLENGASFRARSGDDARPGDLVLCEVDGWVDVRRVVSQRDDQGLVTALDAHPEGRAVVPRAALLGIVSGVPGAGGWLGRLLARLFPLWSRIGALLHWWRQAMEAPLFGERASDSVRDKYGQQVKGYTSMLDFPLEAELLTLLRDRVSPGGAVLVAGSGAGGEALHLARAGYRVTCIDFSRAMVEEGRANAREAGLEIEFLEADIVTLHLADRTFRVIYATPLLYSFIARREHRLAALRRCGRHLAEGGFVLFSAARYRGPIERLQAILGWIRRRGADPGIEIGDWYTRFLTPQGKIGTSFLRLFSVAEVIREVRLAGFRRMRRMGRGHFIASGFKDRSATGRGGAGRDSMS